MIEAGKRILISVSVHQGLLSLSYGGVVFIVRAFSNTAVHTKRHTRVVQIEAFLQVFFWTSNYDVETACMIRSNIYLLVGISCLFT